MKKLQTAIIAAGIFAMALPVGAVIAKRGVRTVTQPDGTTVNIKVTGDEFGHYATTVDDYLLQEDSDGYYKFAKVNENGLIESSGVRYAPNARFAGAVKVGEVDMNAVMSQRKVRSRKVAQSGYGMARDNFPRTGSPKVLIILVQYKDVSFTVNDPRNYYEDMMNGADFKQYNATGSVLKYFTDQSEGKFTPQFDVYGPVTLPNERKYYGANLGMEDQAAELMVVHAVQDLDPTVNFKDYDTNGDGMVDNVYIIYAGQGEASYGSSETVWPHSWDIYNGAGITLKVDDVLIGPYACSNEWELDKPDGIGTFVHEFSHVMGLPDLYVTANMGASGFTPSAYSVLDYGPYNNSGWTPPNYGAYERNALGWMEPLVMDEPMDVTLKPIATGEFGLVPTTKETEFFLFENRQQEGWDKYIPGHGMLIWHIDYNVSVFSDNRVNNTEKHQYVDIEEANGVPDGNSAEAMAGWPFPGTSNKTEFTASTSPAMKNWDGKAIDLPVTDISENNGLITFKVAGGAPALSKPIGYVTGAEISDKDFVARWEAVDGATDYLLTVYAESRGEITSQAVCRFDSSALADGWDASSKSSSFFYTSAGDYGTGAPSYKFSSHGQWLMSPELDGEVSEISLWVKGKSTDEGSFLIVEGKINGQWVELTTVYPLSNEVSEIVLKGFARGANQVRFTFTKSIGNIAVDDIVITCMDADEILPEYDGVSTGGQTSYKVDQLKDGVVKYYFTVQAMNDAQEKSNVSEPVYVDLSKSGVENIITDADADAPVEYYTLQGVRIVEPAAGTVVIRRQGSDVSKLIIR